MGAQALQVGLAWVLLVQVDILHHYLVHVVDFAVIVQAWVLENTLTRHHAVASSQRKSSLCVFESANASITNDRDRERLLNFLDHIVISAAHSMLVVFFAPSMHGQ